MTKVLFCVEWELALRKAIRVSSEAYSVSLREPGSLRSPGFLETRGGLPWAFFYKILTMSSRNEQILKPFKTLVTWEQKYKKIIEWGQQLEPFAEEDKIDKWLIKACQSPLWLKLGSGPKGELIFTGDSSALISKGLLALIIEFYTGRQALEILQDQPDFIKKLDLAQYLSSRRTNGLQAILDQILNYAQVFLKISKSGL